MERMKTIGWIVYVNNRPATYSPRTRLLGVTTWRHHEQPYLFLSRRRAEGAIKRTKNEVKRRFPYATCEGAYYAIQNVIGEPRPKGRDASDMRDLDGFALIEEEVEE